MPHHSSSRYPDEEGSVLSRLRNGQNSAFDYVVNTYGEALIAYAAKIVGNAEAGREVVQDVLLELWHNRTQVQDNWDIASYLYGRTRRRAIDVFRSETAADIRQHEWLKESLELEPAITAQEETAEREATVRTHVWNALSELSPRCREVFMFVWDQRMSYAVIAQNLGIAESTVRRHMSRAVQHLSEVFSGDSGQDPGT